MVDIAQGFARSNVFQTHHGSDITSNQFFQFSTVIGVHLQNTANTLFFALDRVIDRIARTQNTRVNAHEGQLTNKGVGHQLERQSGHRLFVICLTGNDFTVIACTFNGWNIHWRWQVIDHGVQHALYTFVLERGTAQHWLNFAGNGTCTQTQVDVLFGEVTVFQVLVHQIFAGFSSRLDHLLAPFFSRSLQLGRNVDVLKLYTVAFLIPDDRFHLNQVNHTLEIVFSTNRDNDRHRMGFQTQLELVVDLEEVSASTVHLVDERQTRYAVLVGLTPYSFGLRLNTTHRAVNHASAVKHAHGTLNFNSEVNVAGGINDVDTVFGVIARHTTPESGGSS